MANITTPKDGTAGPLVPPFIEVSVRAAGLAQLYIGSTSAILGLCLIAFCTRMYQRMRPAWNVGLDDYFIVQKAIRHRHKIAEVDPI